MAPMDEHGLSEDSLRGSEHFAVRAPAPVTRRGFRAAFCERESGSGSVFQDFARYGSDRAAC
jgi:hypothetical protein